MEEVGRVEIQERGRLVVQRSKEAKQIARSSRAPLLTHRRLAIEHAAEVVGLWLSFSDGKEKLRLARS